MWRLPKLGTISDKNVTRLAGANLPIRLIFCIKIFIRPMLAKSHNIKMQRSYDDK